MRNRILLYAAIYGGIGVMVGVFMALYTKDAIAIPLFQKNGTAPKAQTPQQVESEVNVDAAS